MKIFYKIYRMLIIFDFIVNIVWCILYEPTYIYVVNLLISAVLLFIILVVKGKKQVQLLIYAAILDLIFEPFVVYTRYASFGLSLLSIVIGIIFVILLNDLKQNYEYL